MNVYTPTAVKLPHRTLHEFGLAHVCDDGEVWISPAERDAMEAVRLLVDRHLARLEERP